MVNALDQVVVRLGMAYELPVITYLNDVTAEPEKVAA